MVHSSKLDTSASTSEHPLYVASDIPLGTYARFAATSADAGFSQVDAAALARRERFELQAAARRLLLDERVASCLRVPLPGAAAVPVYHVPSTQSACYGQLVTCGSVWACPVCAAKISERRRVEVEQAVATWRARAGVVAMVTLTFSHGSSDALGGLLESFLGAVRWMASHRNYKALREAYSVSHTVKALEVTWGRDNGWHAHSHSLLFLDAAPDVERLQADLLAIWQPALERAGLPCDALHGVRVDVATDAVAAYVAKFGKTPARRPWGVADELTKAHTKHGCGERYTPFDLLRWLRDTGEAQAGELFKEYAAAFKGRHQLQWSRGARAALGLGVERSDEELATAVEEDGYVLTLLSLEDWRLVVRHEQRAQLLEVACTGDSTAVRSFVDSLWFRACEAVGVSAVWALTAGDGVAGSGI